MGSNSSKTNNDTSVLSRNDLDLDISSDPRSPTPEISRTPLQNKSGAKHNITKNVDLRKTFESTNGDEKLIHNNPILSAVIKNHLKSFDPRSPTQDFERTPVIITSQIVQNEDEKKQLRLQVDKNCASPVLKLDLDDSCDSCTEASADMVVPKNLCHGFFDITLNDSLKDTEEPLGSSTASNEAIENNISNHLNDKPIKLLETNFDYVESGTDKFEETEKNVPSTDIPVLGLKDTPLFKILDVDPRSPSLGIERTPIVVSKIEEENNEDVEEMSDDTLIKVLQCTNAELRQTVIKPQDKDTEGLMIYEDDSNHLMNETPKKTKPSSNSGSRTPLSCMKNKADMGHTRSKSTNTLYDAKDQKIALTKIPKRVSHIPRLKTLTNTLNPKLITTASSVSLKNISKTAAMGGDCENTPPHSHRDRWDKDNSIVL